MKNIQLIKSIQHNRPIKSTHSFREKFNLKRSQSFRAIIIDVFFVVINFVEIFTFLSPKIPIYYSLYIYIIMSYKKPRGVDNFLKKNMVLGQPVFHFIKTESVYHNKMFYRKSMCYIILVIALEHFRRVTHTNATFFSTKTHFMKLGPFLTRSRHNYSKTLTFSETTLKVKSVLLN